MRALLLAAAGVAAGALLLLGAAPAYAVNPVLGPEDDAEIAEALAQASAVQNVCYGYLLQVRDGDTGAFTGDYATSSLGQDVAASTARGCTGGFVELRTGIVYTSSFSESEDSAGWEVASTLGAGAPTAADLEQLGLSATDLLDDSTAPLTLRNAVLALPALAAEGTGLPAVQLQPNDDPLPADAQATGTPGSDWLRENAVPLFLCVLAVLGGVAMLVRSFTRP